MMMTIEMVFNFNGSFSFWGEEEYQVAPSNRQQTSFNCFNVC